MDLVCDRIQGAIAAIYPDIEQSATDSNTLLPEEDLWFELSCCVLSSQVPYSLACAAADEVRKARALAPDFKLRGKSCERLLLSALSGPLSIGGKTRHYRFPKSKARQLSLAKSAVLQEFDSLSAALASLDDAELARQWLVQKVPGLGPKQASMFLRNCRGEYDLAIIDRHVLGYMHIAGLEKIGSRPPVGYSGYLRSENILRDHARAMGYRLGLFDYAVWITMRVLDPSMTSRDQVI
ncbi:8-oxoguanine DNA glycosylase [Bradyrhizobium monzae]|uniref:8-oxoguanine DNA glycosylase n=1 Tax=Bradyrhizobium sp. Oc8 TaxID=2876780 RepID=UPI001F47A62A|nr:DNA lyase [Bradyrhizobium sp. Oc8]